MSSGPGEAAERSRMSTGVKSNAGALFSWEFFRETQERMPNDTCALALIFGKFLHENALPAAIFTNA